MTMAAENVSLLGLTGLTEFTTTPATAEPVVTAQKDDQASSPSLEQVLQEAATKAFGYLDSSSYLSSLFKT
jgi:hypothetical protein